MLNMDLRRIKQQEVTQSKIKKDNTELYFCAIKASCLFVKSLCP